MSHLAEDEDELNTNTAQPKFHAKPQRIPRKSPIKKRGRGRPRVKVSNQEKPGFRERKTYARSKKVDPQEVENENENNVRSGEEEEEEDEEDVGKKGDSGAAGDGVGKGKEGASGTAQGRKGRCKPLAELKRLAQKFKEVDEWELEIEDVTTSSSGLMKDAR